MVMFQTSDMLSAEDKIVKARVMLGRSQPFFGYLVMSLDLKKADPKEVPTMGVNPKGTLFFNEEWVNSLSQDQIEGVLCHEVMHCALQHFTRNEERNKMLANIAQDIVINDMIVESGLELPSGDCVPNNHIAQIWEAEILDVHKKCNEEVYDELYQYIKKQIAQGNYGKGGSGFGIDNFIRKEGDGGRFDEHMRDDKTGNGNGSVDDDNLEQEWQDRFTEAATYAKMQGNIPAGIERKLGKILGSEIDWRGMLYRYITNAIPYDFTWARPNKRSRALGTYWPDVLKEKLELVVDCDTSGSIGQDELKMFMSEIVGIVKQFHNVELTVLFSDTKVYGPHKFMNPNPDEIADLRPQGGGGTDHCMLYDWLDEHIPRTKLLINFTDGYTSFPENDHGYHTIWVLAGDYHSGEENFPFGEVVEIPRR